MINEQYNLTKRYKNNTNITRDKQSKEDPFRNFKVFSVLPCKVVFSYCILSINKIVSMMLK